MEAEVNLSDLTGGELSEYGSSVGVHRDFTENEKGQKIAELDEEYRKRILAKEVELLYLKAYIDKEFCYKGSNKVHTITNVMTNKQNRIMISLSDGNAINFANRVDFDNWYESHRADKLLKKAEVEDIGTTEAKEEINHPSHYAKYEGVKEAADIAEIVASDMIVDTTQWEVFCVITALIYLLRCGSKDHWKKEVKKAIWWLQRALGGNKL